MPTKTRYERESARYRSIGYRNRTHAMEIRAVSCRYCQAADSYLVPLVHALCARRDDAKSCECPHIPLFHLDGLQYRLIDAAEQLFKFARNFSFPGDKEVDGVAEEEDH